MTNNEKIAQWANLGSWLDFFGKDQDAVLLLPVLSNKGYAFQLHSYKKFQLDIYTIDDDGNKTCVYEDDDAIFSTISESISVAVLSLINDK
jgi:hypothetical protein